MARIALHTVAILEPSARSVGTDLSGFTLFAVLSSRASIINLIYLFLLSIPGMTAALTVSETRPYRAPCRA